MHDILLTLKFHGAIKLLFSKLNTFLIWLYIQLQIWRINQCFGENTQEDQWLADPTPSVALSTCLETTIKQGGHYPIRAHCVDLYFAVCAVLQEDQWLSDPTPPVALSTDLETTIKQGGHYPIRAIS